jgi:hypothetical protein
MTNEPKYDTNDPRVIAAHDAGERTAIALLEKAHHAFTPRYVAMAVVQDALKAYLDHDGEEVQKDG